MHNPPTIFLKRHDRGGATFTMVIFVMLLISSGFMYYYFHRTQVLERELSAWKSGARERDPAEDTGEDAAASATPVQSVVKRETLRDLAARLAGTPATRAVQSADEEVSAETPAAEETSAPEGAVVAEEMAEVEEVQSSPQPTPAAMSTPRTREAVSDQSPPLLKAPALATSVPDDREPSTADELPAPAIAESEAETHDESPADRVTSTPRTTPRPDNPEAQPEAKRTATPKVTRKETPITSLYDLPADSQPTVRVRAPRRTPASR